MKHSLKLISRDLFRIQKLGLNLGSPVLHRETKNHCIFERFQCKILKEKLVTDLLFSDIKSEKLYEVNINDLINIFDVNT